MEDNTDTAAVVGNIANIVGNNLKLDRQAHEIEAEDSAKGKHLDENLKRTMGLV